MAETGHARNVERFTQLLSFAMAKANLAMAKAGLAMTKANLAMAKRNPEFARRKREKPQHFCENPKRFLVFPSRFNVNTEDKAPVMAMLLPLAALKLRTARSHEPGCQSGKSLP